MKKEICSFSGLPIHPGHGKRYVPSMVISTKPVLPFGTAKACTLFLKKRNPRKIRWTVGYRRMMKKGNQEEMQRRRAKKIMKNANRAYTGPDVETIQNRRAVKPADRKAAWSAALAEVKDRKAKAKKAGKK
eukprot:TRINITY_DN131_c0_g1_i4.p1 TRINITY_DN131_c0_g1~~TRINITY_DN131_c0_g1_i4.p1  ORF type:complete len:131 (+),score=72.85 TRINITY_DN131_c0_g1_i4:1-393(+)